MSALPRSRLDALLAEQEGIERVDRETIEAIQLKKLNRLLAREKARGGFYRDLPERILSLKHLADLPFTSEEELAQNTPEEEEDPAMAEEKKKLAEKAPPPPPPDPMDEKLKELGMARGRRLAEERRRVSEAVAARIEPLLRAAEKGGRTRDVAYYRSVLQSLIPDYGAASDAPKPEK